MAKRLLIDLKKCTECRTCELKCSFVHHQVYNDKKSGIRILTDWPNLPNVGCAYNASTLIAYLPNRSYGFYTRRFCKSAV